MKIKQFIETKWKNVALISLIAVLLCVLIIPSIAASGDVMHIQEAGAGEGLWEVDGTETQLITADELDIQNRSILNVLDIDGVDIGTLDTTVSTHTTQIAGLDTRLTTAEGNIGTLQTDLDIAEAAIVTAEGDIDDLEGLSHTQGTDTTLGIQTVNLDMGGFAITNVGNVDGVDVSGLSSTVSTHTTQISGLDTRLTTAEGNIATLQTDLDTAEAAIVTAEADIDTLESGLTTHEADTSTHGVTGTILGTEDVDDTPVDGATTDPISSNWAYDHNAEFEDHSASHEFGGDDTVDFTDWIKQSLAVIVHENGSNFDNAALWTQSVSAGMTFTQALVGSYFLSDATAGRTGYIYTTERAFVYDWFHWIALTPGGASDFLAWLWISNTNGASTPSSAQKCAGFKLEDGKIYAYSADGVGEEITEIGDLDINNNSYLLKNNADSVVFYLNGVLEATHSTRYPGAVAHGVKIYLTNKANVAKSLYIRTIAIRRV